MLFNTNQYIFRSVLCDAKSQIFTASTNHLPNTNINILVLDGSDEKFYSVNGTTNKFGFFETKFWIPDNYKRSEFTVTIDAENKKSKSSKILQVFTLGNEKK